jgi:hypothetical protein
MKTATILAMVALGAPLNACVTDSNRCYPGFVYAPQYDACLELGDGGSDGGSTLDAGGGGSTLDAGAAVSDGATAEGGEGGAGLGNSCNGNGDCAGQASYCLKDPTAAPTDPGICTIPMCTAADCGSSYSCCDCSAAGNADLMAWPAPVCVPGDNKTTLVAFGCKCQ